MGQCIVCGRETGKVLYKEAIVKIYICSQECLQKYFKPIGGIAIQEKLTEDQGWRD